MRAGVCVCVCGWVGVFVCVCGVGGGLCLHRRVVHRRAHAVAHNFQTPIGDIAAWIRYEGRLSCTMRGGARTREAAVRGRGGGAVLGLYCAVIRNCS